MNNTGQRRAATKRFIVVDELACRFLQKFEAALAALEPVDPMDKATTLGRLSTEGALVKLAGQVKRAVAEGAGLVMGGKRIDRPGAFTQATILSDIKPGKPAFRDEFLGPVAPFFRVENEDEAVALANDSEFGLGGCVFTKDVARGKRVASPVAPSWTTPDLPLGPHQQLGIRTRAVEQGHSGDREQKAGAGRFDRRPGVDQSCRARSQTAGSPAEADTHAGDGAEEASG
jgi:succinate-semialdehyde dehydrogenase/glutarate-semialdehyde dehydrogenase